MNTFENRFLIRRRTEAIHIWRRRVLTGLACAIVGAVAAVIVVAFLLGPLY